MLPPFCDIPHEETHFAVTVDALAIRLISDFVIAQCMGFEFPASKLSYKLLNYSCSYKNKAHALVVMGSFCFLFAVKPAF